MIHKKTLFLWAFVLLSACATTPGPEDVAMANALCDQAKILLMQGQKDQARDLYTSATTRDANNPRAWNGLGVVDELLGKGDEAAAAFDRAMHLSPDNRAIINNRAHLALDKGDYDQAIVWLEPFRHDGDLPPAIRQNLAAAYGAVGRNDDATQLLSIDLTPAQVRQRLLGYQNRARSHESYADLGSYPTDAMAQAHITEARTMIDNPGDDIKFTVVPDVKISGGIPVFTVHVTGASPTVLCTAFNSSGFPCIPHGK